jgi:hypothetical protein
MSVEEEVDYSEDIAEQPVMSNVAPVPAGGSTESNAMEDDSLDRPTDVVRTKGRGHGKQNDDDRYNGRGGVFERLEQSSGAGPLQCNLNLLSPCF